MPMSMPGNSSDRPGGLSHRIPNPWPHLTLPLRASAARDAMPPWAQARTDASAARNLERLHRVEALYRALDAQLGAAGIDYLALKGLAHCPEFCATAGGRV